MTAPPCHPPRRHFAGNLERAVRVLGLASPVTKLVLDLGRYPVAEAGIYVCRVLERKHFHGPWFLITDRGLHQQLATSGNFGQVIRKNYPLAIGNRMAGRELACMDRFDMMDLGRHGRAASAAVKVLRKVPPLRFLGHVVTPCTLLREGQAAPRHRLRHSHNTNRRGLDSQGVKRGN